MRTHPLNPVALSILAAASAACAQSAKPPIPPAPIRGDLPDPAFDPVNQCDGAYPLATLKRLLPRARLALRVPGTDAVDLDPAWRCLRITVEDTEAGRFAALLLRGLGVPRRAVLLQLATPELSARPPRVPRERSV